MEPPDWELLLLVSQTEKRLIFQEIMADNGACRHSETGIIPVPQPMLSADAMGMLTTAEQYFEDGRPGCALAILKVLRGRPLVSPEIYHALRERVHRRLGIPS